MLDNNESFTDPIDIIKKKKTNFHDLQRIMAKRGELCNEYTTDTYSENKLGQKLVDAGIQIISDFKIDDKSFDFKVYHYPILIEVDGGYHNGEIARERDYKKDRRAQKHGFTVMRFSNNEVNNQVDMCVREVQAMIRNKGKSAREIWLYPYTIREQIHDWWTGKKYKKMSHAEIQSE